MRDYRQGTGEDALLSALVPRASNCFIFVPKDSESDYELKFALLTA